MTITTSILAGRLPFPDDTVPANAYLRFTLSGVDTEGKNILPPAARTVELVSGEIPAGFDLWRNSEGSRQTTYSVDLILIVADNFGAMTRELSERLGTIQIGVLPEYDLADLLVTPSDSMGLEAQLARINAAVATSSGAASASAASAAAALVAREGAEDALDAATLIASAVGAYRATTIAAAKALGVAAHYVGDVFTAAADDVNYIGLYKITTGPVATEIAKYPTAQALEPDTWPTVETVGAADYVFLYGADGSVSKILATRIGEDMTPTYWFDASADFGTTAATLIATNNGLKSLRVQNASPTATIAIALGGRPVALNGAGSITLAPGQMYSEDRVETGAVTVISSEAGTPVTCSFARTENTNPNSEAAWNALLARFTAVPSSPWQAAIKKFHDDLFNRGILAKMRAFYVLAGPDATSALLNWSAANSATAVAAPTWTIKQGFAFNGTTQYLNTGLQLQNLADVELSDISMFVKPDTTDQATGRLAMGDGAYALGPNITAATFTVRGGASTADTISGGAYGNLAGVRRTNPTTFDTFTAGNFVSTVTKNVLSNWLSNNLMIGCTVASGVPASFYAGQIRVAGVGRALTDDQFAGLNTAITTYLTDIAGL